MITELESSAKPHWQIGAFDGRRGISSDSVFRLKSYMDTAELNKLIENKKYPIIYSFSKPVFIKDSSMFVLYLVAYTLIPSTGQMYVIWTEISLYKKKEGEWKKWFEITSSIICNA